MPNPNDRLMRYLLATPAQQAAINEYLDGRSDLMIQQPVRGPLLLGMGAAAKYLGVSRATLWRMIQAGKISKVEVLSGSFRVRRADIERIARGEAETEVRKQIAQ